MVLTNLFSTLPVRKKEFQKNIKKEFTKLINLLQEYALILTGIKINCWNLLKTGVRNNVLQIPSNKTTFENIVSIYGKKQSKDVSADPR